ncbi:flagellar hook-basal body complex protein [Desulfitobacterium sp.]|uniref:flagellar hook-basal body complex protein n=1 Tax=Desulfitobacterium sp. TaxID=49981 RepID=UPI002D15C3AF|nr:flagellar hook-basal body complex protein [Desulfitobacterium sp.]HVJ49566.1 flagellar hook-basal body complex protein [Desulfitobacterium sp.]
MMRSLYSAISGLKNHQTKMDVIGNNIANVNTTGFKKSRVTFSTMLSQTMKGASTPTAGTAGGTNPMQVGLGSSLASIDQIMTDGSQQTTGNPSDLKIAGPGFFTLKTTAGETVYSRSGAFNKDALGQLVDPASGALVLDSAGNTITIDPATYGSYDIAPTGVVTGYKLTDGTPVTIGAGIQIATFPNPAGLTSIGGSFYKVSNNSGAATSYGGGTPYPSGTSLVTGALEMSNVDLSQEFTDMITAQRGFQANSRVITVSDTMLQELIDLKRN